MGFDAFWEDTLAAPALSADPYDALQRPEPRALTINAAPLVATNAHRRAVVFFRDSRTGAETAWFRDAFEARRSRSLRPDVDDSAWSHLSWLAVNNELGVLEACDSETTSLPDGIHCARRQEPMRPLPSKSTPNVVSAARYRGLPGTIMLSEEVCAQVLESRQ